MEIMTNLQPLCDVLGPQKKKIFFTTRFVADNPRDWESWQCQSTSPKLQNLTWLGVVLHVFERIKT